MQARQPQRLQQHRRKPPVIEPLEGRRLLAGDGIESPIPAGDPGYGSAWISTHSGPSFDVNGDGTVSAIDLVTSISALNAVREGQQLQADELKFLDSNRDGQFDLADADAVCDQLNRAETIGATTRNALDAVLGSADADIDLFVDLGELASTAMELSEDEPGELAATSQFTIDTISVGNNLGAELANDVEPADATSSTDAHEAQSDSLSATDTATGSQAATISTADPSADLTAASQSNGSTITSVAVATTVPDNNTEPAGTTTASEATETQGVLVSATAAATNDSRVSPPGNPDTQQNTIKSVASEAIELKAVFSWDDFSDSANATVDRINQTAIPGGGVTGPNHRSGWLAWKFPIGETQLERLTLRIDTNGAQSHTWGKLLSHGSLGSQFQVLVNDHLIHALINDSPGYYPGEYQPAATPVSNRFYSLDLDVSALNIRGPEVELRVVQTAGAVGDVHRIEATATVKAIPVLFDSLNDVARELENTVERLKWIRVDGVGKEFAIVHDFSGTARAAQELIKQWPGVRIVEPRSDQLFRVVTSLFGDRSYLVGMEYLGGAFRWLSDGQVVNAAPWGHYSNWRGEILPEPNSDNHERDRFVHGQPTFDDWDGSAGFTLVIERDIPAPSRVTSVEMTSARPGVVDFAIHVEADKSAHAIGLVSIGDSAPQAFLLKPGQEVVRFSIPLADGSYVIDVGVVNQGNRRSAIETSLRLIGGVAEQTSAVSEFSNRPQSPQQGYFLGGLQVARLQLALSTYGPFEADDPARQAVLSFDETNQRDSGPDATAIYFGAAAIPNTGAVPNIATLYIQADYEEQFHLKRSGWDRFWDGFTSPFESLGTLFTDPGEFFDGVWSGISGFFRNPLESIIGAFEALGTPEGLGAFFGGLTVSSITGKLPIVNQVLGPLQNPLPAGFGAISEILAVPEWMQSVGQFALNPVGTTLQTSLNVVNGLLNPAPSKLPSNSADFERGNEWLLDDGADDLEAGPAPVRLIGILDSGLPTEILTGDLPAQPSGYFATLPSGLWELTLYNPLLEDVELDINTLDLVPVAPIEQTFGVTNLGPLGILVEIGPTAFGSSADYVFTAIHEGKHVEDFASGSIFVGYPFAGKAFAEMDANHITLEVAEKYFKNLSNYSGAKEIEDTLLQGNEANLLGHADGEFARRLSFPTVVVNLSADPLLAKRESTNDPMLIPAGGMAFGIDGFLDLSEELGFKVIDGSFAVYLPRTLLTAPIVHPLDLAVPASYPQLSPLGGAASTVFRLLERSQGAGAKTLNWVGKEWRDFFEAATK